jgi:hypothetical protein
MIHRGRHTKQGARLGCPSCQLLKHGEAIATGRALVSAEARSLKPEGTSSITAVSQGIKESGSREPVTHNSGYHSLTPTVPAPQLYKPFALQRCSALQIAGSRSSQIYYVDDYYSPTLDMPPSNVLMFRGRGICFRTMTFLAGSLLDLERWRLPGSRIPETAYGI